MNEPSTVGKNWQWRLTPGQLTDFVMQTVLDYTCIYGRDAKAAEDDEADEEE
jgi:4-alpha-glucanotransferase